MKTINLMVLAGITVIAAVLIGRIPASSPEPDAITRQQADTSEYGEDAAPQQYQFQTRFQEQLSGKPASESRIGGAKGYVMDTKEKSVQPSDTSVESAWGKAVFEEEMNNNVIAQEMARQHPNAFPQLEVFAGENTNKLRSKVLKYNVYTKEYSYEDPDAIPRYNPYTDTYEMATPFEELKYNKFTKKYSYEPPSAEPKFNPYSNEYEMAKPTDELMYNVYTNQYTYEDPGATLKYNPHTNEFEMAE